MKKENEDSLIKPKQNLHEVIVIATLSALSIVEIK